MSKLKKKIAEQELTLVFFFAGWCVYCREMLPVIADIKQMTLGKAKIYLIDTDKNIKLDSEEEIHTVPTIIIYRHGKEAWRFSGIISADEIMSELENAKKNYLPENVTTLL